MSIIISKERLGFDKHLHITGESYRFVEEKNVTETWHLDNNNFKSILRVANATCYEFKLLPNDPRAVWWNLYTNRPRYDYILGKEKFRLFVKDLIRQCQDVLKSDAYYLTQYQVQNKLLDSLKPAHVNLRLVEQLSNDTNSIVAHKEGICQIAEYDNFSSSTGRMSIINGPKVLTMHKENRVVFKSKWGEQGTLLSIDYRALEPRVIMTLMGRRDIDPDIYTDIGKTANIAVARDVLKLMVLAVLYGMSRRNFIVKFMEHNDPDVIYDKLHDVLGVNIIRKMIAETETGGKIKNYFGRNLRCDNESLYVNHYTQSTAVDVACDGFMNLVESLGDEIDPIFILHDELIIDIKNNMVDDLKKKISSGLFIPSLDCTFPITTKVFNARKGD